MLTYHLKPHDQQPLYEQLYHAVRADIMSGALPGGTRLPSKRQLAANLRVSQITVETAYGQLAAEGYIASAPRRGYFVQEQLAVPVSEPQEPFAPPLPPISASEETYPYDFRTDFVDNGCFPFSTWARLSRSVLSEYSSALLRATDPCGAAELREEIVRYLHDFRGINVSPDNILIGAGSEYLMHLVIQLLGRDRVYALENPGYRKLYQIFAVNGVTVRPTPLDKHGLRADALAASDASVVYLTPSHHFPLGTVMTAARRLEILRVVVASTATSSRMTTTATCPPDSGVRRAGSDRPCRVRQHLCEKPCPRTAHRLSGAAECADGALSRTVFAVLVYRVEL